MVLNTFSCYLRSHNRDLHALHSRNKLFVNLQIVQNRQKRSHPVSLVVHAIQLSCNVPGTAKIGSSSKGAKNAMSQHIEILALTRRIIFSIGGRNVQLQLLQS